MLNGIINWSLHHRFLVMLVTVVFIALGLTTIGAINVDAFPDTTPI